MYLVIKTSLEVLSTYYIWQCILFNAFGGMRYPQNQVHCQMSCIHVKDQSHSKLRYFKSTPTSKKIISVKYRTLQINQLFNLSTLLILSYVIKHDLVKYLLYNLLYSHLLNDILLLNTYTLNHNWIHRMGSRKRFCSHFRRNPSHILQ